MSGRPEVAVGAEPAVALAAGQLIARQRTEAEWLRQQWPEAWKAASEGNLRTWLA